MHFIGFNLKRRRLRLQWVTLASSKSIVPVDGSPKFSTEFSKLPHPYSKKARPWARSDRGSVGTESTSESSMISSWSDEVDRRSIQLGKAERAEIRKSCLRIPTQIESLTKVYSLSRRAEPADVASNSAQLGRTVDRKGVTFNKVTIHRHLITLGDNPSPSEGPPISIEWKAFDTCTLDFEAYEESKPRPREHRELQLPRQWREGWLLSSGIPRRRMQAVQRENRCIQKHRQMAVLDYFFESHPTTRATRREVKRHLNRRSVRVVKG